MRNIKELVVVAALAIPAFARAHNGVEHIKGTVKALSEQGLTVETTDEVDVKVLFDDKTKFEKNGSASSVKELHSGERVVVNAVKKGGSAELLAVLVKFGGEQGASDGAVAQVIRLTVTADGFTPNRVRVKKDNQVTLVVTRKTETTCATAITIADYGIRRELPLNEPVAIIFTPTKTGDVKYACAMNMIGGVLVVE